MAINFTSEIIDHKQYIANDSKITKITTNPIIWHLFIEIEGKKEELDLVIYKTGGSYTVSIKNTNVRATPRDVLHIASTDRVQAIKDVLRNWEKLYRGDLT